MFIIRSGEGGGGVREIPVSFRGDNNILNIFTKRGDQLCEEVKVKSPYEHL